MVGAGRADPVSRLALPAQRGTPLAVDSTTLAAE